MSVKEGDIFRFEVLRVWQWKKRKIILKDLLLLFYFGLRWEALHQT